MGELREDPSLRDHAHPFRDRAEGGRALAVLMENKLGANILAIPPGGVPLAASVASELSVDYHLFLARSITHPSNEVVMGGMAWGGRTVWDRGAVRRSGLEPRELRSLRRRTLDGLRRQARIYGVRPALLTSPKVVLVDDGSAGWATLVAAAREARSRLSAVALAVPMMTRSEALRLINEVDVLYCPCLLADDLRPKRRGWWGHSVGEPEALAMWLARERGPENTRNPYHTVSSSSGISHDR